MKLKVSIRKIENFRMSRKNKKNLILENIKLLTAGAKGVAIGRTEEGKR
jgi:23S rRNA (uracil1939-C5)-methyltransferase